MWPQALPKLQGPSGGSWAETAKWLLQNYIKTEYIAAVGMWARIISSALATVTSTCIQEWSTCWGKEVLQEGQCCSQPAQSRANVACFLHARGLMHYLPCVSQRFLYLLILLLFLYSLLFCPVPAVAAGTYLQDWHFGLELEAALSGPYLVQCHQMCSDSPSVPLF